MICQNCGTQNANNSRFCIKCGSPINASNVINNAQVFNIQQESSGNIVQQQPINNNIGINNFSQTSSQVINNTVKNENLKMNFIEYFTFILGVILKPYTSFKDKLNNFNEFKNSAILSIIVSISAMLISLVKTIISTVCVTTGGLLSESKTEWIWENLKEIQFVKVIGMNLLAFLGIILAIACVYYIAGLVIKKQPNFSRLLGIAAVSVVPILLSTLIFFTNINDDLYSTWNGSDDLWRSLYFNYYV